jgi:hypothetical protein
VEGTALPRPCAVHVTNIRCHELQVMDMLHTYIHEEEEGRSSRAGPLVTCGRSHAGTVLWLYPHTTSDCRPWL